jgi:hypothetical protein
MTEERVNASGHLGVDMRFLPITRPLAGLVLAAGLLWGCVERPPVLLIPPPKAEAPPSGPTPWRDVARDEDVLRLESLDAAWTVALATARRARFVKAIDEEGPLLEPRAALTRPETSPGRYQCRLIRFAGRARGPAVTVFKPYFCYVEQEGDLTTLVKETGTERQAGRLWPDSETRLIFLGALAIGTEKPPAYGERRERDLAGVLERVAPFRWRLVIPRPKSGLDVLEMVPFTGS